MHYELQNGKRVEVFWSRSFKEKNGYLQPYRTMCAITIRDIEGDVLIEYDSTCHKDDNFNKKKGRLIAFNKCLRRISEEGLLSKEERRELFNLVFPNFLSKIEPAEAIKRGKVNVIKRKWTEFMDWVSRTWGALNVYC